MKLKKMLAAATSAALAISTMAFTPLTASADWTAEAPVGTEEVLATLVENSTATATKWTDAPYIGYWEGDLVSWNEDPNVYLKLTASNVTAYDDGKGNLTDFNNLKYWEGLSWFVLAKVYENDKLKFETAFSPIVGSTSDCAISYLPFSNIKLQTGDDGESKGIGFNFQSGHVGFTLDSLEIVRVSPDTTTYGSQNVPLVELTGESKNNMNLPGIFDLSKVSGPQARLEISFTTSGAWGGIKLVDATDSANLDYDNPLATIKGTDVVGSYTKSIKLSDLGSSAKTIWLNTWSVASIDSIVIYNDTTKGDIYTIPVADVLPDAVEITRKNTEVVGTPAVLTANVSNKNAEITVKYKLEWTVTKDGAATTDATIVPGENNTATLTATKAGEYYVVCAVKSEDGKTEYVSNNASFIFTAADVKPVEVSVSADRDDTITDSDIVLTANIKGAADATVNVPCDIVWTVSGEGATVTPSEDGKTATVTSSKAGEYTVTCTVNAKGETEKVSGTVDVKFKEPVKPEVVTVTADKTTVTAGTPVTISRELSSSDGKTAFDVGYGIKWSVSPESGATIKEKGMDAILNATEAGEYTVTCTVHAEGDPTVIYATGTVTVTVEAATNPFDLTVEKDDLYVGESTTASAKRDGEAISVKWTSSDEKIATVDENGVITAVAVGNVTITATPEDGSPRSVVITVVAATKEYMVTSFVNRLYNTLLGRNPDEHSADHKNDLLADKTACEVARNFVLSEEFLNKGLTNEEVVDKMYMTFLGRPADEAGKADWVNRLNNGCSYAHVFYGFTQCNEFAEICADYGIKVGTYEVESPRDVNCNLTAFVTRLYGKVLDRKYDVLGLDNHTAKYLETGDIYAMAYDFIFSPEFVEKKLSDEDFVEIMYNTFFDRASDPEGKANWLKLLAEGGTREDVLKGFVGSNECAELVESFKI